MVDKSSLVAHTVTVYHHSTVQIQAVMVTVVMVLFNHPVPTKQHREVICDPLLPAAKQTRRDTVTAYSRIQRGF